MLLSLLKKKHSCIWSIVVHVNAVIEGVFRKQSSRRQSASQADCKRKEDKEAERGGACLAEHFAEYRESHSIRKPGSVTFRLLTLLTKNSRSHVVSSTRTSQNYGVFFAACWDIATSYLRNVWSGILNFSIEPITQCESKFQHQVGDNVAQTWIILH